ncbi:hypothetical protein H8F21_13460 [Pseudomonas sp. P66]|uniref:Uncharacterized protein n=1 Tax=Pseudomonas arcuscaelestis TaxID=2710591 RepID=A0ABS2BZZ9_9PSED|nr:hypothetical protein [Pseudomonas arcuscaelestis]MBM5458571.1 hypothetical protein [Pseudomonas arcuscaelestis]
MQSNSSTPISAQYPAGDIGMPSDEILAEAIRKEMSVEAISAERETLTQASKARYEAGDRTGLPAPSGHYMAGDAAGMLVLDWMTQAERTRFHVLALALPTSGEEQEAARLRIQARIAARRANKRDAGDQTPPSAPGKLSH